MNLTPFRPWSLKPNDMPSRTLSRLQRDFDRAVQDFFDHGPQMPSETSPNCELTEDDATYYLKFDVPGVKKEDVKIEIEKNQVTVSCERREERKETGKKNHYSEISYGMIQRSVGFTTPINEQKARATFENGVLTVVLPKAEPISKKQIAIQ